MATPVRESDERSIMAGFPKANELALERIRLAKEAGNKQAEKAAKRALRRLQKQ